MIKLKNFIKKPEFYIPAILFLVVLASRLFLLNGSIDFFDSTQYIWRSELPTLKEAFTTGHAPFHPGYIFFTWITFNIFKFFGSADTSLAAMVPSAIFGSLTVLFYYLLAKKIFDWKIALLSAILVASTPFFWISNLTIIVDPTMIFFYILSLYLFYLWLDSQKYSYLIISGFALGFAMWSHTQIAFWSLGFLAIFIYKVKFQGWLKMIIKSLPFLIGILFFIGIYLYLLVTSGHNPTYLSALKYLFAGNAGDHMPYSLIPGMRNYSIIMTILAALFSIFGIVKMLFDKKYREFWLIAIWLFPGLFLSALYLYANLYGRSCMIAIFPGMMAVSYFLLSWKAEKLFGKIIQIGLIALVICQILFVSLPIIKLYAQESAALEEVAEFHQDLSQNGLYITSNQAKTLYYYDGKIDVVWEMPKTKIDQNIDQTLNENNSIYIGQDAIIFPYYIYDGHNWEIKSTNLGEPLEHQSIANYLFAQFNFNLIKTSQLNNKTGIYKLEENDISLSERLNQTINEINNNQSLVIGRIIDKNLHFPIARNQIDIYSEKPKYIVSPEKINYNDLIYQLYNYLVYISNPSLANKEPLIFNYSDKSGYFTMNLPQNQADNIELVTSSYNLSTNDIFPNQSISIQFSKKNYQTISPTSHEQGVVDSPERLAQRIDANKSFYLAVNKNNNQILYDLYYFEYGINLDNKIEAVSLASDSDKIMNDQDAQSKTVRRINKGESGYLSFGPWINIEPGTYQVDFRMKIDSVAQDDDEIGYIEITADNHNQPIAKKILNTADFQKNGYQDAVLYFSTQTDLKGVEFRIKSNGAADIYLDNIKISKK